MTDPISTSAPDRTATSWSLVREVESVRSEAVEQGGRVARMLLKTPEVRVVVVGMARGVTWPEHIAGGRVLVRVEHGSIELRTKDVRTRLSAGILAAVEPGEAHDVYAIEDSAFLLFVAG